MMDLETQVGVPFIHLDLIRSTLRREPELLRQVMRALRSRAWSMLVTGNVALNAHQQLACMAIFTSVFAVNQDEQEAIHFTGEPGAGKTHACRAAAEVISSILGPQTVVPLAFTHAVCANFSESARTLHSKFLLSVGSTQRALSDVEKTALITEFTGVALIVIDEISMVSSEDLSHCLIRLHLAMSDFNSSVKLEAPKEHRWKKTFALVGDYLQIDPVQTGRRLLEFYNVLSGKERDALKNFNNLRFDFVNSFINSVRYFPLKGSKRNREPDVLNQQYRTALNHARSVGDFCADIAQDLNAARTAYRDAKIQATQATQNQTGAQQQQQQQQQRASVKIGQDFVEATKLNSYFKNSVKINDKDFETLEQEHSLKKGFFEEFMFSPQSNSSLTADDLSNDFFDAVYCTYENSERQYYNRALAEVFARETGQPLLNIPPQLSGYLADDLFDFYKSKAMSCLPPNYYVKYGKILFDSHIPGTLITKATQGFFYKLVLASTTEVNRIQPQFELPPAAHETIQVEGEFPIVEPVTDQFRDGVLSWNETVEYDHYEMIPLQDRIANRRKKQKQQEQQQREEEQNEIERRSPPPNHRFKRNHVDVSEENGEDQQQRQQQEQPQQQEDSMYEHTKMRTPVIFELTETPTYMLVLVPRSCFIHDLTIYDLLHDQHFPEINKQHYVVLPLEPFGVNWIDVAQPSKKGSSRKGRSGFNVSSFGVELGYASTFHKVIGRTVSRVVLDLSSSFIDFATALVGLTRTPKIQHIKFLRPDGDPDREPVAEPKTAAEFKQNRIIKFNQLIRDRLYRVIPSVEAEVGLLEFQKKNTKRMICDQETMSWCRLMDSIHGQQINWMRGNPYFKYLLQREKVESTQAIILQLQAELVQAQQNQQQRRQQIQQEINDLQATLYHDRMRLQQLEPDFNHQMQLAAAEIINNNLAEYNTNEAMISNAQWKTKIAEYGVELRLKCPMVFIDPKMNRTNAMQKNSK
jgi:hypothetical protein